MDQDANLKFYKNQLKRFKPELERILKQIKWTAFFRLIAMILFVWLLVKSIKLESVFWGSISAIAIVVFFILVSYHKSLTDLRDKLEALITINKSEIEALSGNFSGFSNGKIYLNPEHEFTYDLDIFGENSIFQFINRTCTQAGERLLAAEFIHSPKSRDEILKSQEILEELEKKQELLQDYRARGMLTDDSESEQEEIKNWASQVKFRIKLFTKLFVYLIPALNILFIVLSIINIEAINYLILSALTGWFFYGFYFVRINRYHSAISRKQSIINKYLGLSKILAKAEFENPDLVKLREVSGNSVSMLKQMDSLMNLFDTRLNLLVGFILNTLLLMDFHIIIQFTRWKKKHKSNLEELFDTHARFDVLVSKSVYLFNNPGFTQQQIASTDLEAKDLGHPLIHPELRVNNDFYVKSGEKIFIITGANMAGKSTFLRSVGVNLILAGIGLKVCASNFKFNPKKLITGMRTTDSLAESESYFFAELKRLQRIVQGLEKGESYFILLDEILKGTNSTDKHLGSEALIRQLAEKTATSVIATHDLKLGDLEKSYPGTVRNYHFESQIKNDELIFDYKLREGIAVNMNASFLMKKMGIIP